MRTDGKYILIGKDVVKCTDLEEWAKWFETAERRVAKTERFDEMVSTVFLGMDHSWGDGPPVLFETMVFGGNLNGEEERYCTYEEAEEGHKRWVKKVFGDSIS